MKASHQVTLIILLALVGLAVAGLFLTGGSSSSGTAGKGQKSSTASQQPSIDQTPLQTAVSLAGLAATPDETQLATAAQRLADHEVDLAFAAALRDFKANSAPKSPEARSLQKRIQRLGDQVSADQAKVKAMTAAEARAKGDRQAALQQQIEITQARLDLDQDALADAQQDMARSGTDAYSAIQRLWQEHEAAEHTNGSIRLVTGPTTPSKGPAGSLIAKGRNWYDLHAKKAQLIQAQQDALNAAARLGRNHDALEKQVQQEQPHVPTEPPATAGGAKAQPPAIPSHTAQAAMMSSLHHLSQDEKDMADLDQRIQDLRDLSSTYGKWIALVSAGQRAAIHEVIRSALWIVLLMLFIFLVNRLADRLLTRLKLEHKQQVTLRSVLRFAVEALAVLIILFVIFGSPSQILTVLGLATAGLTVALKDFVVSFCGWFLLMGRNGIRVGDSVEINGVRGEVMEIRLFRTVLLETGNWTDAGHPTGRQVSFLNSFAVEGYFFNFSTSGQWLWDEFQVQVPSTEDPYAVIEKIRAIVTAETQSNAKMAELEWQRVTRRYGVGTFSALPTVDVRPTDAGVQVAVRYMTRASERSEVRARLNHAMVELFHGKAVVTEAERQPAPTEATGL
ncbi:MAG: mechanosensitive ion channel domain-containing protein [Terriglobia bacterium]